MTTAAQTTYTILRRHVTQAREALSPSEVVPDIERWEVVGELNAAGARPAVRKYLDGLPADERDGTFVATPSRSFVPVTVKRREVLDLS